MLMHALMAALSVFICFAGNYLTGQSGRYENWYFNGSSSRSRILRKC
ncbi:MAG: hypothetical protein E7J22_12895 [Clostridium perfringens]|nr:hypothetical protein [Clostridium perfringens]